MVLIACYCKEIKFYAVGDVVCLYVIVGGAHHVPQFGRCECVKGICAVFGACLDFGKDNCVAAHGYYVNLVAFAAAVAFSYGTSFFHKDITCYIFAPCAGIIVDCHVYLYMMAAQPPPVLSGVLCRHGLLCHRFLIKNAAEVEVCKFEVFGGLCCKTVVEFDGLTQVAEKH